MALCQGGKQSFKLAVERASISAFFDWATYQSMLSKPLFSELQRLQQILEGKHLISDVLSDFLN